MTSDGRNLPVFLTSEELAAMIRTSKRTLEDWRLDGKGPPWVRAGVPPSARVLYPLDATLKWLTDNGQRGGTNKK